MLTDKKAQQLFNESNDMVREIVQRMVLVIENENPALVNDELSIAIAAKWERERFEQFLREAREIIKLDIKNIRAVED